MLLKNDILQVDLDESTGVFQVLDLRTQHCFQGDPWEKSPANLDVIHQDGQAESIHFKSAQVACTSTQDSISCVFTQPYSEHLKKNLEITLKTKIFLEKTGSDLSVSVEELSLPPEITGQNLEYPLRSFHLLSEKEPGFAIIPYVQGVMVPSFMYPMRNSKFGIFDDTMYTQKATGSLEVHNEYGLSMAWYGIQGEKSSVMTFLPDSGAVNMRYYYNYNDRDYFAHHKFTESPFPRILSLYPQWKVDRLQDAEKVTFRFLPQGSYPEMAKEYRKEKIASGNFVTLKEKAKKVPSVNRLAGDIYVHLYGGYPHYIDYDGMFYDFDQLKAFFRDLHDVQGVEKAFVTVWGCFENYPPIHWPINQRAGGEAKLKEAFDLAKSYGYHVTPYHSWCAMLEHDPLYDEEKLERRRDGTAILRDRWGTVNPALFDKIAMEILPKEMEAIGSNASYSDALQTPQLRQYLSSLNIPLTQERKGDSELSILEFHRLEGMAPHSLKDTTYPYIEIPLFNLVYHDCVLTCNRWQSPDNDYDLNGDYALRCLRNMLYGNEVSYVVPYYEYPGIKKMIAQAKQVMAPLHEETAFEELLSHRCLGADFSLQQSKFANGVEVTANLSLVDRQLEDGTTLEAYGFRILHQDGRVSSGVFRCQLDLS